MTISVTCPTCGSRLRAPEEAVGKSAPCPRCGNSVRAPDGEPRHPDPAPARPSSPPDPVQTARQPRSGEQMGRRPPRRSALQPGDLRNIVTLCVCIVVGGVLVFFAMKRIEYGIGTPWGGPAKASPRVTKENFLKIQLGMNHQDVTLILGEPTEKLGEYPNPRLWKWKDGSKEITTVIDRNGNVEAKVQQGLQ